MAHRDSSESIVGHNGEKTTESKMVEQGPAGQMTFGDTLPQGLVKPLLRWYAENARPLPWRLAPDPYRVWVSEIMLQQTRVEAVKPYYERFLAAFPNLYAFAAASEDVYLKYWEGLGYYSRVRNMHRFAVIVTEQYGGVIPSDRKALLSLPGIGPYTAGAIASIAYGVPVPAVDGNVLRVVARLTADERDIKDSAVRADIETKLSRLIPRTLPGDFNQALIELGATVCIPNGEALCGKCPVRSFCRACAAGAVSRYPVRSPRPERRIEQRTVLLITDGRRVLLRRRPTKGLLAGLYEFPNILGFLDEGQVRQFLSGVGLTVQEIVPLPSAKHVFTHLEWHMTGYLVRVEESFAVDTELPEQYLSVSVLAVRSDYALPSAFSAYRACLPDV